MTELSIPSTDQKNRLHVEVWEPEGEIRAILQISHGMVEYVERFQEFAHWLNRGRRCGPGLYRGGKKQNAGR